MRIKEFLITRYGPISYKNKISLSNFNLIWGNNEEGKTLTVDALVKLLLGRDSHDFENIERVDETPEGYVIIEDKKGNEVKLPEKGKLTDLFNLKSYECHNIFIIRNSNLSIARDVLEENNFFVNVTDRLIGIRTSEISEIIKNLREIAKITPKGLFKDTQEEKLKTNISNAENCINEIESLIKEIEEKKLDELEENIIKLEEQKAIVDQEISRYEDARKREKYEKGEKALNELAHALEQLKELEIYNVNDEQLWQNCENQFKDLEEQKKKLTEEIVENKQKLEEKNNEFKELERECAVLEKRKEKIDSEIMLEIKNYETFAQQIKGDEIKFSFYKFLMLPSGVFLLLSILGIMKNPSAALYTIFILSLSLTIFLLLICNSFIRKKAKLSTLLKKINLILSKFALEGENIERINFNIQNFTDEYEKKKRKLEDTKLELNTLNSKIKELETITMPNIDKKIQDLKEKITEIKIKSGAESLEKYIDKLQTREKLERTIGDQKAILGSLFGKENTSIEENLLYWKKEVTELEQYKDKAKDLKYSEKAKSDLEEKRQELEQTIENMNKTMKNIRSQMGNIERKVREILQSEEDLTCNTLTDLKLVKEKLQQFIDNNERNRDNALEVIKIFEEIEKEEKEKVTDLFGKESSISKIFSEITDHFYEEVIFNQETEKIEVRRVDGKVLEADKLSGGAYDQLYFSIRVALGEKLLKGEQGFFIMDDPFIKADPNRLNKQIEVLKQISKLGWQIIYFSAKGEIRDLLKEDYVNKIEIHR
ncbi:MAG: AAA family ATPase [Candidatus Bilamarchaeaceae archaeon]